MRIQMASDLHLDYASGRTWPRPQSFRTVPDRDLLVLAAEIGRGLKDVPRLRCRALGIASARPHPGRTYRRSANRRFVRTGRLRLT